MSLDAVLSVIVAILLWASVAGAFLTLTTFGVFSELRTYPIKLIMFLCSTIIGAFVSFFFSSFQSVISSWLCWPTAILVHYFFLANFAWCFCVAFNFYQMIVRRNREAQALEKWYHLGSWCMPAIIVVIVAALGDYGRLRGSLCYITSPTAQFVAFFVPGLVVVAANCVLFVFVAREIQSTLHAAPKTDKRHHWKEFRVYLSIFVSIGLTWIFGFLMFLIPNPVVQQIFLVLFSLSCPLQGVLIFITYCVSLKVIGKWAGLMTCCPGCGPSCARIEEAATSSTSYSRL